MPEIRPFRAWRYAGNGRDLSAVIAPPYDVIDADADGNLRRRDPHNVVRLILPRDVPGRPDSRYAQAGAELEAWAAEGVLRQDPAPSFYPYRQTYRIAGRGPAARVGFLGLLKLQPFGGQVLAHERTLAGPREDRFRLIAATHANLSPVFVLFEDPSGEVARLLEAATGQPPVARAERGPGEQDELWRVSDRLACEALENILSHQPTVFADGHHRYESALRHKETLEAQGKDPGSAAYVLAFFAPAPQPGLSILPTHRIVHHVPEDRLAGLDDALRRFFEVQEVGRWREETDVRAWEARAVGLPGVVLALARRADPRLLQLVLQPGADTEEALAALEAPLRELDVSVLHEVILRRLLGLSEEDLARQTSVRYPHESLAALQELDGDAQAVFLLRPTPIGSVFKVARAGLRMPQKSTFFYPKLATGFLIHRHE